jgi:hypothetical protein
MHIPLFPVGFLNTCLDWFGHGLGMPLIVLGYFLSFIAEGFIRVGAWLAGRTVVEPE